jgi:predicted site-specific integrase-resolvase
MKNILDQKKSQKYSKLLLDHSKIGIIKEYLNVLEQNETTVDISCQMSSLCRLKKQNNKRNICYCRVSTSSQKEDLERQVEYFRCKYPDYEIVKDIGSGINFKRKGFNSILDSAFKGDIGEIVVTHRDRLCRFGFELVLRIIESTNGKILVLDKEETSPEKELVNDILSIITVFSSRLYGLRSNSIKNKIREATSSCSENTENTTISESGGDEET